MSMAAIRWAYVQDEKPGPKAVLVCLAWHADKTDWRAFPGIATLARETGLKERAIAQHLETLERRRLVTRERRHAVEGQDKGKRLSDAFQLQGSDAGQSADIADELPANSADSACAATRNSCRDNPQISQTLPADSDAVLKKNLLLEPRSEPAAVPPLLQTGTELKAKKQKKPPVEQRHLQDAQYLVSTSLVKVGKTFCRRRWAQELAELEAEGIHSDFVIAAMWAMTIEARLPETVMSVRYFEGLARDMKSRADLDLRWWDDYVGRLEVAFWEARGLPNAPSSSSTPTSEH